MSEPANTATLPTDNEDATAVNVPFSSEDGILPTFDEANNILFKDFEPLPPHNSCSPSPSSFGGDGSADPAQRVSSSDWCCGIFGAMAEALCTESAPLLPGDIYFPASDGTEASSTNGNTPTRRLPSSDFFPFFFSDAKERRVLESASQRVSSSDWIGSYVLNDRTLLDEPGENDVIVGRGGGGNNHKGNKKYLMMVADLKARYRSLPKVDKTKISWELVNMVHANGGRFVQRDKGTNTWTEVDDRRARRKASQALREKKDTFFQRRPRNEHP